tara:strand:+ start:751 stop:1356 length:606 start_codon:yes stop_codon:yes gene_type:complete
MAYNTICFDTQLPKVLTNEIIHFINNTNAVKEPGRVIDNQGNDLNDPETRKSTVSWLDHECWIWGFLWHYINQANKLNFKYDLSHISSNLQISEYTKGEFFNWHADDSIASKSGWDESVSHTLNEEQESVRKLTFSLSLSGSEEFTGGEFEILGPTRRVFSPQAKPGRLIIFDSTAMHRVRPVKSGKRRALVGWVLGPRWR